MKTAHSEWKQCATVQPFPIWLLLEAFFEAFFGLEYQFLVCFASSGAPGWIIFSQGQTEIVTNQICSKVTSFLFNTNGIVIDHSPFHCSNISFSCWNHIAWLAKLCILWCPKKWDWQDHKAIEGSSCASYSQSFCVKGKKNHRSEAVNVTWTSSTSRIPATLFIIIISFNFV